MPGSIEDRLMQERQRTMVGRSEELAFFKSLVQHPAPPFCVLHVWGEGGIGKTTLMQTFAQASQALCTVFLDARDFEASPDGLLGALRAAFSLGASSDPIAHLYSQTQRLVLLVDSYDLLSGLDNYFRESFLPRLPGATLVVLAGRNPLCARWRGDPGWQSLIRSLPLHNLSAEESAQLLSRRSIPQEHHDAIMRVTHGFPLALSLLADVYTQRGTLPPNLLSAPELLNDIVPTLLARLIPPSLSSAHRSALEICALARVTDETLLEATLSDEEKAQIDLHDVFHWLQNLSFIETGHQGVFPHDIARDAITADLRWRNQERYLELHRRIRAFYATHIPVAKGPRQQRLLYDCIFLHRDSAIVRAAFTWQDTSLVADNLQDTDHAAIIRAVRDHEGVEAGALVAYWLQTQPQAFHVFRDAQRADVSPAGFFTLLALDRMAVKDREVDTMVETAWRHLNRTSPLRTGESATYLRFWMATDTHQAMSPVQSLILVHILRYFLTQTRPAYTFFCCHNPVHWESALSYLGLPRVPEAEPQTTTMALSGVFGRDWRTLPPVQWLAYLAEREEAADQPVSPPGSQGLTVRVLSETDFKQSVLDALRMFPNLETLEQNPLGHARLVVSHTGLEASASARASELRTRIQQAAQSLQTTSRTLRGYRALYHTYLQPVGTQEQAATVLGLPFNTYRHHLAAGIADITRLLWLQETGASKIDNS